MNKKLILFSSIFLFFVVTLFFTATRRQPIPQQDFQSLKQRKVPEQIFLPKQIKLLNNKTWQRNTNYNYVVVNFWATWCPPCLKEIPELNKIANESDSLKIEVIGVSMDQEISLLKTFLKKTELSYPSTLYSEVNQYFGQIQSIPTTMIFDKENKLIYMNIGLETYQSILNSIKKHEEK